MKKYTVSFQVKAQDILSNGTALELEADLRDLLTVSVLPALGLELVPLTFTVKKARG